MCLLVVLCERCVIVLGVCVCMLRIVCVRCAFVLRVFVHVHLCVFSVVF